MLKKGWGEEGTIRLFDSTREFESGHLTLTSSSFVAGATRADGPTNIKLRHPGGGGGGCKFRVMLLQVITTLVQ